MNEELTDELKGKMIYNAFVPEDRAMMFRQEYPHGGILRGTERASDFEETVREEITRLENTANVVTAVHVRDERVEVAVLLGESADEELVGVLIERAQYRIYNAVEDTDE